MQSSVAPLVFLTVRSVVNGVKRALTNARRLVGLVMVVAYYVVVFIRPFDRSSDFKSVEKIVPKSLPDPAVFAPWVFLAFATIAMFLSFGILTYRGAFRPADVDVLFPTPVEPKVVLVFRIVRDYLATLLFPLFLALVGYKGASAGLTAFLRSYPGTAQFTLRAMTVSWFLLAFTWVCIGYAASLFVNRSDLKSDRNRRIIGWTVVLVPLLVTAYAAFRIRADLATLPPEQVFKQTIPAILNQPLVLLSSPTAWAATAIVMAPLLGNWIPGLVGLAVLVGTCVLSLRVAMSQASWMYDQAAARGFDAIELKALQKKGDMAAMHAYNASRGKLKKGKIAAKIARWTPTGGLAIVWREFVVQARTTLVVQYFFTVFLVGFLGFLRWTETGATRGVKVFEYAFPAVTSFFVFLTVMTATQSGYTEFLRRGDVQKPLPLGPTKVCFWEVAAKAAGSLLIVVPACLAAVILKPSAWDEALATLVVLPTAALTLASAALTVTILFPDVDDPTQRGFRGLMNLLGLVITASPGAAIAFLAFLPVSPTPLLALLAAPVNVGIAVAVSFLAGNLYASFSPNE